MTSQDFKIWKQNIYNSVKDISDYELQKLSWTGNLPNVVSSFVEVVNTLHDFEFESFIDYLHFNNYDKEMIYKMQEFSVLLNKYDSQKKSHLEILADDNWIVIVNKAKDIVNHWDTL